MSLSQQNLKDLLVNYDREKANIFSKLFSSLFKANPEAYLEEKDSDSSTIKLLRQLAQQNSLTDEERYVNALIICTEVNQENHFSFTHTHSAACYAQLISAVDRSTSFEENFLDLYGRKQFSLSTQKILAPLKHLAKQEQKRALQKTLANLNQQLAQEKTERARLEAEKQQQEAQLRALQNDDTASVASVNGLRRPGSVMSTMTDASVIRRTHSLNKTIAELIGKIKSGKSLSIDDKFKMLFATIFGAQMGALLLLVCGKQTPQHDQQFGDAIFNNLIALAQNPQTPIEVLDGENTPPNYSALAEELQPMAGECKEKEVAQLMIFGALKKFSFVATTVTDQQIQTHMNGAKARLATAR